MKTTSFLLFVLLCFAAITAEATKKKSKKKNKSDIQLVEAYTQRILPGMRRPTPPPATTHFIVVWEGSSYPDAFFWYADTELRSCSVTKVHKIIAGTSIIPPGKEYYTEKTDPNAIRKGDTLDVVPVQTVSAVPKRLHLNEHAGKTLFYKILTPTLMSEEWYSLHIDTITRKRDIAMP